ncbi:MAG: arsenate reductase ArsC [Longicatena sp.]
MEKIKVAFICVHNACRSQIAQALGKHYASDVFESYSAGTQVQTHINQDACRLMKTRYQIDMEKTQESKLISTLPNVDIVITMGCNVSCPNLSCRYQEDWGLEDPSGKSDDEFNEIISKIEYNIKELKKRIENDISRKITLDS